ncbi:MAG: hypothetical protein AAGD96_10570 [Chloroflexota bacterium]
MSESTAENILFYGYYDDFAGFFAKISKELSLIADCNVHFLSGFPSGVLAWRRLRQRNAKWLAPRVIVRDVQLRLRWGRRIPHSAYGRYSPKWVLDYEMQTTGRLKGGAGFVARAATVDKLVKKIKPKVAVISGDSRPTAKLFALAAQRHGAKVFYFEQGPFGTTFLDASGVNANLDTSLDRGLATELGPGIPPSNRIPQEPRGRFFRALDYAMSVVPAIPAEYTSRLSELRKQTGSSPHSGKMFTDAHLLVLQVPDDANFRIHSAFSDFKTILRLTCAALPAGHRIAVREHPKFIGQYGKEFYQMIEKDERLCLQKHTSVDQALKEARTVVTINSMMGFEALMVGKKVFCLGNSYYAQLAATAQAPHTLVADLSSFFQTYESKQAAEDNSRQVYIQNFFTKLAIPGHFRDQGTEAAQNCAKVIAQDLQSFNIKKKVLA